MSIKLIENEIKRFISSKTPEVRKIILEITCSIRY